jgi:hypothetical protein
MYQQALQQQAAMHATSTNQQVRAPAAAATYKLTAESGFTAPYSAEAGQAVDITNTWRTTTLHSLCTDCTSHSHTHCCCCCCCRRQVPTGRVVAKAERERQREEARRQREMEKARAAQVIYGHHC